MILKFIKIQMDTFPIMSYEFPMSAVTKYHKVGGLKKRK